MRPVRTLLVFAVVAGFATALPPAASSQDLFELEVFEFPTTPPGTYVIGFHTNGVPQSAGQPDPIGATHHPVHLSVEMTRGWTERVETAVFVQTAPFGPSPSTWFAGGHVRGKIQLLDQEALPFRLAFSAEYGFNRASFDDELQTLELTPILDRRLGRLALIVNPSVEFVTGGSTPSIEPTFDLSARVGWSLGPSASVSVDYFSRPGTTRHLDVDSPAHHLIFPAIDVGLSDRWSISIGAGHCVTSSEPWVVRSVLGLRIGS